MLKSQDIVALMKLAGQEPGWTFDSIAAQLKLSPSAVHRSLKRAEQAGLYSDRRRSVNNSALLEFLVHGAKYLFPAVTSGESRGFATAWAASPLNRQLSSSGRNIPVWPDAHGDVRGIALEPIHQIAVDASKDDPGLREMLVLLDGIRVGSARERAIAEEELTARLSGNVG